MTEMLRLIWTLINRDEKRALNWKVSVSDHTNKEFEITHSDSTENLLSFAELFIAFFLVVESASRFSLNARA